MSRAAQITRIVIAAIASTGLMASLSATSASAWVPASRCAFSTLIGVRGTDEPAGSGSANGGRTYASGGLGDAVDSIANDARSDKNLPIYVEALNYPATAYQAHSPPTSTASMSVWRALPPRWRTSRLAARARIFSWSATHRGRTSSATCCQDPIRRPSPLCPCRPAPGPTSKRSSCSRARHFGRVRVGTHPTRRGPLPDFFLPMLANSARGRPSPGTRTTRPGRNSRLCANGVLKATHSVNPRFPMA